MNENQTKQSAGVVTFDSVSATYEGVTEEKKRFFLGVAPDADFELELVLSAAFLLDQRGSIPGNIDLSRFLEGWFRAASVWHKAHPRIRGLADRAAA